MERTQMWTAVTAAALAVALGVGCAKKTTPVVRAQPPADLNAGAPMGDTATPPSPTPPIREETIPPPVPVDGGIGSKDLDALNRDSPLGPVFFALDSYELSAEARTILQASAKVLQQQASWHITVEGHCDERGTAEYNLSLGERRALAAKTYLVSLGIGADRLRTVSYGKEFPFDPGHDESAWAKNRRAHFVITSK